MKSSSWSTTLMLGTVVVFTGLGTLAMVLSLSAPTRAEIMVFASSFLGTLLIGALIPSVRRNVFGIMSQLATSQPEHTAASERGFTPAPEYLRSTSKKPRRSNWLILSKMNRNYTRVSLQNQSKRVERK